MRYLDSATARWGAVVTATIACAVVGCSSDAANRSTGARLPLPLQPVGEMPLPGDSSRFDYASLDSQRGWLFVAHLGASEVVEVDIHSHQVVRTIANISQVHGVLVVPERQRVYATATGTDTLAILDENTGEQIGHASTGEYPDGLAYDRRRGAIWTTNETGGTETVIDADSGQVRGTVDLGAEVGNVVYDAGSDRVLVAVQGHNTLAVIDPATLTVTTTVRLPDCHHPHGLALDTENRLAFVACDASATLLTLDQTTWQVTGTNSVGDGPDVLAYDPLAHRLYVAAESGWVTILDLHDYQLAVVGNDHLADGAHVVAVDPNTHRSYYPIPAGSDGHPALLERQAT